MKRMLLGLTMMMVLAAGSAWAVPISGTILFSGMVELTPVDSDLDSATGLDFQNVVVLGGEGTYADVATGTSADYTDFTFDPLSAPVTSLWSFDHAGKNYSFDLTHISVDRSSGLFLSGFGVLNVDGFDATEGVWNFSTQDPSLKGTFSFSASSAPVPEPGTLLLLGGGLAGLAAARRRKKA